MWALSGLIIIAILFSPTAAGWIGYSWKNDINDECLHIESLYPPDGRGFIHEDIILDRHLLLKYKCVESREITKINGNLEIGPSKYLKRVSLHGLKVIGGSFAILGVYNDEYNHGGKGLTLHALHLEEVREFLQIRYTSLRTFEIPRLKMVGRTFEIKDNPILQEFDLPNLHTVGLHLVIQDNPTLLKIYLPRLEIIRWDLWIQYNTKLRHIETPELTTIGEDYELHFCGDLVNIIHPKLDYIGEDFEIYSLLSLKKIHFPKLRCIGEDLEFDNCPILEIIDFPELSRMDEDFTISSLPNLAELNMPKLQEVGEDFEFITVGLPELNFPSLYLIESDTLLTDMPKLEKITLPSIVIMEGAIEMNGLPRLEVFHIPVQVIGSNPSKDLNFTSNLGQLPTLDNTGGVVNKDVGNGVFGGWRDEFGRWRDDENCDNPSEDEGDEGGIEEDEGDGGEEDDGEAEEEIDQRFYITGCDNLRKISLPNLKNITGDTMLIFDNPKLEEVLMPVLDRYQVEEDDPDGLEFFAIAANPNLRTIILSQELNEPKLFTFVGNAISVPTIGPSWAFNTDEYMSQKKANRLFFEALCPNDDDHHTESNWERKNCLESYNCPDDLPLRNTELLYSNEKQCVSLRDLYDISNRGIDGSIIITHTDVTCITCDGIQKIDGCVTISNNKDLEDIQCNSLEEISGSFDVFNNPKLSTLEIDRVKKIGGIGLYVRVTAIKELYLPRIKDIHTVHVLSNPDLTEANFDNLRYTRLHFHFLTNPSLKHIDVPSLEAVGVGLNETEDFDDIILIPSDDRELRGNDGDIHLEGNTAMNSYSFPRLVFVGEDVEMFYSPWLTNVGFPKLLTVEEDFELYYFLSLREVELPKLTRTGEDLEIWDLAAVLLISLPSLRIVDEDYEIFDCLLLQNIHMPSLERVDEDFDVYVNRELTFIHAPSLKIIAEDIQMFGNDHLVEVSFPVLEEIAVDEGGGFLITTNRLLKKLSFPKLKELGKNRGENVPSTDGPGDFGYDYPGRDGDEALFLYSAILPDPFIVNRNRPFMICDNPKLQKILMPKLELLASGGFFFEANPKLHEIDISRLEFLNTTTYFIIRHNHNLRQGSLHISEDLSDAENEPLLANLKCNTPYFCVEPPAPEWMDPICSSSGHYFNENFCPEDTTFPSVICDSTFECTDAYYLWARENDYDFEENVVQLSSPPQFSAIRKVREARFEYDPDSFNHGKSSKIGIGKGGKGKLTGETKSSKTGAGKGFKTDKDTSCEIEVTGHPKVCLVICTTVTSEWYGEELTREYSKVTQRKCSDNEWKDDHQSRSRLRR